MQTKSEPLEQLARQLTEAVLAHERAEVAAKEAQANANIAVTEARNALEAVNRAKEALLARLPE